jgi:hypothetical protein
VARTLSQDKETEPARLHSDRAFFRALLDTLRFSSCRPIYGDDIKGISFLADVDFCNDLAIA